MKKKRIISILVIAFMAALFMWLLPFGSFDPKKLGFYLCIILAIFNEVSLQWLIAKYRVKSEKQ